MFVVLWKDSPRIALQFGEIGEKGADGIFATYEAAEAFAKANVWEGAVYYIASITHEVTAPRRVKVRAV